MHSHSSKRKRDEERKKLVMKRTPFGDSRSSALSEHKNRPLHALLHVVVALPKTLTRCEKGVSFKRRGTARRQHTDVLSIFVVLCRLSFTCVFVKASSVLLSVTVNLAVSQNRQRTNVSACIFLERKRNATNIAAQKKKGRRRTKREISRQSRSLSARYQAWTSLSLTLLRCVPFSL